MKNIIIVLFIFLATNLKSQINYADFFTEKSLRFDYIHAGNATSEQVYFEQMKEEPFFGGSKINLLDTFNYGEYQAVVIDSATKKQIYTHNYCTLFEEWQNTDEAKTTDRSFYESVSIPFPKRTIILKLFSRHKENVFDKILTFTINPKNKFIVKNDLKKLPVFKIHESGLPENKVDLVIIPDGYTKDEIEKFKTDATKFKQYLFNSSPYKENTDKFNVNAVFVSSEDEGTDIPGQNIWKNTALNTSFFTFDSERYLMTYDYKTVKDVSANVAYDQIIIIVNTDKYGGGGIFNYYSTFSANNKDNEFLFIHEFGHAFAGLGDEYFDSSTPYESFYSSKYEPWQPNLTNLYNFSLKWKNMMDKNLIIPTPATKENSQKVGVYEGGGYVTKGIYRPFIDCTMKSIIVDRFCPVCKKSILNMILFHQ